ncbi:hypothetical protein [Pseudomonas aeruginosa]|uniref:hypothetical protein n=1 Tax=Pseudomonas aeruginosa TaxID=287 RepID=UPI000F7E281C|nr:hypothetical protein [Pseudomonas aeruginosa]RTB44103.1 hypothetical protein EJ655_08165 [Pseudomonas aeruginosa]
MPEPSSNPLYRIDECPDLMADACVGDDQGNLTFVSLWGRDTAIQQFIARLTLGHDEDGLDQFHIINDQGASIPVFVGSVERLQKRMTRAYRRTLFGSLTNLWLFDRRCSQPDKSNASAFALLLRDDGDPDAKLWQLVRETCPLPLLDHWQSHLLVMLRRLDMLRQLPKAIGPLDGYRVSIDMTVLAHNLGELIRLGVLTADESIPPSDIAPALLLEVAA